MVSILRPQNRVSEPSFPSHFDTVSISRSLLMPYQLIQYLLITQAAHFLIPRSRRISKVLQFQYIFLGGRRAGSGWSLRSPIGRLVSLIKHMVGVALEKSPSRVRKSSDSPDRLSNATESRYRGSNATKVALERL